MFNIYLLGQNETEKWNKYLMKLSSHQQDIYFTHKYYRLFEELGDGIAQCFVFEKDMHVVLYPFLINSVNKLGYDLDKEYFDIQGVYGYNGVLTNCDSPAFLDSFFACFDDYCQQHCIIAEFLRINPLLQNPLFCRTNFELIYDRNNINVNLLNENIFETEYEYSTRKNIRKAIKSGLTFKYVLGNEISSDDLNSFCKIYDHTMKRNNADDYYYFDTKFFNNISTQLSKKALFVFDLFNDQVISCELVLLGNRIAYSFLGGTLNDYYQYRPNDFLKHETITLLKNMGFHNFLLGGGSDGVFKYKKSFSKNGVIPFYIGKKIHNTRIYNEVINQWEIKYPEKIESYKKIVLKYRY
jgi:hypothetical protein